MLYLVPTPVGNLADMTYRAVDVLNDVDTILAEDTRQTKKLLTRYDISTKLQSFHSHNEHRLLQDIIERMKLGESFALVSDAGSPGISDPGFLICRECHKESIQVIPLPGPTAFVPALTASGLPTNNFYFEGFLPQKKGRHTKWLHLQSLNTTIVLYESPFRLLKCLREVLEYLGEGTVVCVAREISKVYEDIQTKTITDMIEHYDSKQTIKGEIVVIIDNKG